MAKTWLAGIVLLLCSGCTGIGSAVSKQADYHFQMGVSHLAEDNVTSALVELSNADRLAPDQPETLYYLGLAYFRKGKFELAEQKYLRALSLKPDYTIVRNELGVNYLEMHRWDDAINQLKLVIEDIFHANQTAASINLGLAYYGKGDYPKALEIFRVIVVENPGEPRGRLHLGKVYFAMDRVDLAMAEYRKALQLFPDYAQAHYQMALASLKAKDTASSIASFREVVRIAPDTEIGHLAREHLDLLK